MTLRERFDLLVSIIGWKTLLVLALIDVTLITVLVFWLIG